MCATRTCASNGLRLACFGLRVSIDLPISARPLSSHSPHRSDRRFLPSFFCTDVGVADFAAGVQSGPVARCGSGAPQIVPSRLRIVEQPAYDHAHCSLVTPFGP